jgi:hypothetical protein
MNVSARNIHTSHNSSGPILMHDIVDPSSPLSILAATSKLTTFPYGELTALKARMNVGATEISGLSFSGVNGLAEFNGLPDHNVTENGFIASIPNSLPSEKITRSKERAAMMTEQSTAKTLLPSALPPPEQSENFDPISFQLPTVSLSSSSSLRHNPKQRKVAASLHPRIRSSPISRKKPEPLSSTQNTRSSKRLKTAHSANPPTLPPLPPPPPKFVSVPPALTTPASTPLIESSSKKRVLPVRQGHIDILDGEISFLSTPQRLDSNLNQKILLTIDRPSFELSHKVILVNDSIPSTPTSRYEPFSSSTIPDPNTSPTATRPKSIAAAQVIIRPLAPPSKTVTADPLPDSLYLKSHRKHEFTEIRLRNREREKIDYESTMLERQLSLLKNEDWRKFVAPAAAERDGLKVGEAWDWEGRRERRIELLEGVLKRVRTWREAEIKMRRGMLEKKPDPEESNVGLGKRKRKGSIMDWEEEDVDSPETHHEPQVLDTSKEEAPELSKVSEEGKKKRGGRKKQPIAFGHEIPKAGMLNREFQIPLEWVPEGRRL